MTENESSDVDWTEHDLTFTLTWKQRDDLAFAFRQLNQLPEIWHNVAEETKAKQGNSDYYALGVASGNTMVAKGMRDALDKILPLIPRCKHDKAMTETCGRCM